MKPSAPPSESSSPERPIAFYRVADGKPQIWLVEPGSDPVQLTSGNSISSGPAWSPDGSVIAIANREPGKPAELAVVTIVDKQIAQLTTAAEVTGRPTWSPDGKQIAFAASFGNDAPQTGGCKNEFAGNDADESIADCELDPGEEMRSRRR